MPTSTPPSSGGTIDAAEFICPYDDEKLGLPKVAKFNYFPCWWESGGMIHMVVNLEKWNALPKAYQSALARACDAACSWMLAKYDSVNPAGAQTASSPAVPCSSPSRNRSWRPCYRATKDHAAELSGKDIHFKRAFDSMHAFRKEQLPWWEISEHAYDSFMQSTRGRA